MLPCGFFNVAGEKDIKEKAESVKIVQKVTI